LRSTCLAAGTHTRKCRRPGLSRKNRFGFSPRQGDQERRLFHGVDRRMVAALIGDIVFSQKSEEGRYDHTLEFSFSLRAMSAQLPSPI
jgi:hypothetical protein